MGVSKCMCAIAAVIPVLFSACGGESTLPEPPPCPTPTATATPQSSRTPSTQGLQNRYFMAVQAGTTRLTDLLTGFRSAWPENKFYRTNAFREEYTKYAGAAGCVIADLARLTPPTASRAAEFDAALKAFLSDYDKALKAGTDAVRTRNTTDYRAWAKTMDELTARQRELVTSGR